MENELQVAKFRNEGMESIARFFNVYGPRQDSNGAYAAVISKFISLLHQNKRPTIFGDGGQKGFYPRCRCIKDIIRISFDGLESK